MQAVGLLRELGYTNLRHYSGGMTDWIEHGGATESTSAVGRALPAPTATRLAPGRKVERALDMLADRTTGELASIWLGMVAGFGAFYWLLGALPGHGLLVTGVPNTLDAAGLLNALYFSFVTATSVGYGDVTPLGIVRAFAVVEATAELLIFGGLVSKFVGRRQEELMAEMHLNAFEDRLGRVRINLHLILAELQQIDAACEEGQEPPARTQARLESSATVLAGELQAVHALLYRPFQHPEEGELATILASLDGCLAVVANLVACMPRAYRESLYLRGRLAAIATLAGEICGECVPRTYAAGLKQQMDRIQELSRQISAA